MKDLRDFYIYMSSKTHRLCVFGCEDDRNNGEDQDRVAKLTLSRNIGEKKKGFLLLVK